MYPLIAVFFYYFINTIESVRLHPENEFTIPVDQPLFITVEEEDADLEDVFTRFHELLEFHGLSTHTENTDPADEEHLIGEDDGYDEETFAFFSPFIFHISDVEL